MAAFQNTLTYPDVVALVKSMAEEIETLKKDVRRLKALTLGPEETEEIPPLEVEDLKRFLKFNVMTMIEKQKKPWPFLKKPQVPPTLSRLKQNLISVLNDNLYEVIGLVSDTDDDEALYPKTVLRIMNIEVGEFEKALKRHKILI
jgi:hypothetical protein